jgi:predicted nuclease of restriction endonuclease-like (RecB) superfamily
MVHATAADLTRHRSCNRRCHRAVEEPEQLIRQELTALRDNGELTPAMVFQDPYMLDFLELKETYSEKDLESALLREIERFLLKLGAGFAFVETTGTTAASSSRSG